MQKAYHVLSTGVRELVDATIFDHSDYGGIFQCPHCDKTLTLRSGHKKGDSWIDATFVHPEGNPTDCLLRAPSASSAVTNISNILNRGQSSKKLERAFLKCLKFFMGNFLCPLPFNRIGFISRGGFYSPQLHPSYLKKYIAYNSQPDRVHKDPTLLMEAFSVLVSGSDARKYIDALVLSFESKLFEKKDSLEYFSQKSSETSLSVETLIRQHCSRLNGVLRYICRGASNELRKKILEISIWADPINLPVLREFFETQSNKRFLKDISENTSKTKADKSMPYELNEKQRLQQVQLIRRFDCETLSKIVSNPRFVKRAFSSPYENSPERQIIEFVLERLVSSVRMYNWEHLLNFYNTGNTTVRHSASGHLW